MKPALLIIFLLIAINSSAQSNSATEPKNKLVFLRMPDSANYGKYNFLIYTDFVGFKSDNPNGLVQTEFNASIPLLQSKFTTIRNQDTSRNSINFFTNIFTGFVISKIENKERAKQVEYFVDSLGRDSGNFDTISHVHTMDLLKYAGLNIFLKFNLMKFTLNKDKLRIYVDLLGQNYWTYITDSINNKSDNQNLIPSFGLGGAVKFSSHYPASSPINFVLSFEYFSLKSHSPDVEQRTGILYKEQSDLRNHQINLNDKLNYKNTRILTTGLVFKYRGKEDLSNETFLRFNYSINFSNFEAANGRTKTSGYFQAQLGYIGNIEDMFSRKSESKNGTNNTK